MRIPTCRTETRRDHGLRDEEPRGGRWVALVAIVVAGCGGGPEAQAPVVRETPKDAILRVAATWESQTQEKAFRSPPSPVIQYTARVISRITFAPDRADVKEALRAEESFRLADGAVIECGTELTVNVGARYAEHAEEPAAELSRPAIHVPRVCARPGLPEPALDIPATVARFALRGDRLVPYAPSTEKREYIPAP